MKIRLFLIILLSSLYTLCLGNNYNLKLKLKNCTANKVFLAHYFNGKVFITDTTTINSLGEAIFSKDKKLHSGLYIIYLETKQYFDILIGEDQNFTIQTDINAPIKNMKIIGSDESAEFVKFQLFLAEQNINKKEIISKNKDKNIQERLLCDIDNKVRDKIRNISQQYPNTALTTFTTFSLEPIIPDYDKILKKNVKNRKDSINKLQYFYNKNHYWDNANLNDSTLLRTPMLKSKLDIFFNKIIIPHPDTIFNEATKLIERSKHNKEMFRYMTSYCFNFTLNSKIMGMDNAFYKIAEEYYLSGKAYWATDTTISSIQEKITKLKYSRIGEKAKDITLQNLDGEWINLYDINKQLTVLVFWEPDCGHCKKIIPLLKKEIADKYNDIEIIAIYIQNDKDKWISFIEEHELYSFTNCYDPKNRSNYKSYYNITSTPMIYLLDKDKTIIAKKIDVNSLSNLIKNRLHTKP